MLGLPRLHEERDGSDNTPEKKTAIDERPRVVIIS